MFSEIELKNIRIFNEIGKRFSLPMLSVFCGTNNSGKSTILKSLLLLRQSQGIRESEGTSEGRLRFVGSQVDLGNYQSFVYQSNVNQDMTIGLTLASDTNIDSLSSLLEFHDVAPEDLEEFFEGAVEVYAEGEESNADTDTEEEKGRNQDETEEEVPVPYSLKATFVFAARPFTQRTKEQLSLFEDSDELSTSPQGALKRAEYELNFFGKTLLSWRVLLNSAEEAERDYKIVIPKDYLETVGGLRVMELPEVEDGEFVEAPVILRGILPFVMFAKARAVDSETSGVTKEQEWGTFPLPPHITGPISVLNETLGRTHYIGPLRAAAKRYYVTNFDINPNPDPAGEFIPYTFRDRDREPDVWHVRPGEHEGVKEKLSVALNTWLYFLRTGKKSLANTELEEISVSAWRGVFVEFEVKTISGDQSYPLADSGFGYSQVLPILVRGLLARPGSILIVEQPEVHLNPALQVRLAEFFVAMAHVGKQVIIETHSEHIVNMIRVLAAEDETGAVSKISAIFFLDFKNEKSIIHELSIKEDGTIPEWPHNFFGEAASLTGRLLRAQKRYRNQLKSLQKIEG